MSKESFSTMEVVIAVGALVTSAAAVYIAWDQAKTMHVEQHASVFPAIQIDPFNGHTNGSGLELGWMVENAGVGPAFIKSARLLSNSQPITGYEEISGSLPVGVNIEFKQLTGRVLAPGVGKEALKLSWHQIAIPREVIDNAYAATGDWRMEVCYCSTLDRCWTTISGQREHPKRVDACTIATDSLF